MFQMGFADLQHRRAKRREVQPVRDLVAERAHALRDRAHILSALALASDDQNKAKALRLGVQDEADQLGVGLGQGHSVQVDPGFGLQLATGHLGVGARVRAQGRLADEVWQGRREVTFFKFAVLFAQKER